MIIKYPFTFLNEYIALERGNKYKAAKVKRDTTFALAMMMKNKPKWDTPCGIKYTWYVKSKRRDIDNIAYAAKYVNDAMVKAGLIKNDNLTHITHLEHRFEISDFVGVMIERID